MAKDSGKKKKKPKKQGKAPAAAPKQLNQKQKAGPAKESKVRKAVKQAASTASKLTESPLVTEVVAAALVATAAAIKDPKTARRLAEAAGSDLEDASKKAGRNSEIFWNLALDVARRSLESMNGGKADKKGRAAKDDDG